MKRIFFGLLFGIFGMIVYPLLEILWRGNTHISMVYAGGLSAFLVYLIFTSTKITGFFWRVTAGALAITAVEFVFGAVCNLWLSLGVWDYHDMPFQLWGQICLPYALLWWGLCLVLGVCFGLFRKLRPIVTLDKPKIFDYNEK